MLTVAVGLSTIFDMREEEEIYNKLGGEGFKEYQLKNIDKPLKFGSIRTLMKKLLHLKQETGIVDLIIISKQSPITGLRAIKTINEAGWDINTAVFLNGKDICGSLISFDVDLFLSRNSKDVSNAIECGVASAQIFHLDGGEDIAINADEYKKPVRMVFDGDSVLFDHTSELIYKEKGLEAFTENEINNKRLPIGVGPFMKLLQKIHKHNILNQYFEFSLVTARSIQTLERALLTLEVNDVQINNAFFMGGKDKTRVLKMINPDIFFDDQDTHVHRALNDGVVSAKVVNPGLELNKKD